MLFPNTIMETRALFYKCFQAHRLHHPLSPLEQQITDVILAHPEYHPILEYPPEQLATFTPEQGLTNPFLHMGLHLAIRDQVSLDKPLGIQALFNQLKNKTNDHEATHQIMDVLAMTLWEAQSNRAMPDDRLYMERLSRLL